MEKILLILESDTMCKALSEALINYEVCACNADKAPETFMRFCPDALILDLFLPGIDGFTLMEGNNALLPTAILLLSVLDSDYVRKRAAQLGVDCYDHIQPSINWKVVTGKMPVSNSERKKDGQWRIQ